MCTLFWDQSESFDFTKYDACDNDDARSAILHQADYGTIIYVYDNSKGEKGDDWTEIKVAGNLHSHDNDKHVQVKALVAQDVMIDTFEKSQVIEVGDGTVEITHHHRDNLDGKVSRVEIVIFKE